MTSQAQSTPLAKTSRTSDPEIELPVSTRCLRPMAPPPNTPLGWTRRHSTSLLASLGLYQRLRLPLPWLPAQDRLPLAVYGAASAVGAFAVKLATLSNIHPIVCVAGRGKGYVETLIDRSKGDTIVDYRDGNGGVVKGLQQALGSGERLKHGCL
jgi:hypothetical protein